MYREGSRRAAISPVWAKGHTDQSCLQAGSTTRASARRFGKVASLRQTSLFKDTTRGSMCLTCSVCYKEPPARQKQGERADQMTARDGASVGIRCKAPGPLGCAFHTAIRTMRSCLVSVDQEMLRGAIIVRLIKHGYWLVLHRSGGVVCPTLA